MVFLPRFASKPSLCEYIESREEYKNGWRRGESAKVGWWWWHGINNEWGFEMPM